MNASLVLLIAIGIAGGCGALARFGVAEWVSHRHVDVFPLATLLINVTGAFALGLLVTATGHLAVGTLGTDADVVLGTGFLGGYTTFSTLSFETHTLLRRGYGSHAWLNALGTLLAGMLAAVFGIVVGHAL